MKLTGIERRWLGNVMEALIPPGGEGVSPVSALEADAGKIFEEMLLYLPASTGAGLRASIYFMEFLAPFLGSRRAARFSSLGPKDREACLLALSKSDSYFSRQMVLLHKSVACLECLTSSPKELWQS